jgi:hypothetical protein
VAIGSVGVLVTGEHSGHGEGVAHGVYLMCKLLSGISRRGGTNWRRFLCLISWLNRIATST